MARIYTSAEGWAEPLSCVPAYRSREMETERIRRYAVRSPHLIMAVTILLLVLLLSAGNTFAAETAGGGGENAACLGCHGSRGMSATFKSGEKISLYIAVSDLSGSVHRGLSCSNCHLGFSAADHPYVQYKNRRQMTTTFTKACMQCHEFKQGIHRKMLDSLQGVICSDCHGSHAIKNVADVTADCYGCHKYNLTMTFRDGVTQSLMIDPATIQSSVHEKLRCADCHFGFSSKEHPERVFAGRKDFTVAAAETCRRCHFDKYTKTLEGIHFNIMSRGDTRAPVCIDCHGAHGIQTGRQEKVRSARKCEKCHEKIYNIYIKSVHGAALISEHNQDVPVCSDCHRAHDIPDPHKVDFRNDIPQMCGNCHANAALMKKYGLSTQVLDSYLEDFHGVTLTFYKKQERPVRHIAVCIDCHGIHDITKATGPDAAIVKANLLKRCRKCHPGASDNFPDSWISHYQPNFKRAPLVYAVNMVYSIFIPFMIVGLVLQIVLHIWRYAVNR